MLKRCIILVIFMLTFVSACGGSAAPVPSSNNASYEQAYDDSYEYEPTAASSLEAAATVAPVSRMIIKNAHIELEADDSVLLYNTVVSKARTLGGYEASYSIDNFDDYSVISAQIRIPSEKFDELNGYINESGNVINSSMSSEDITEDYLDVKIRLDTKRTTLKTYYNLLEKASTVEEIIQLQRTIDDITMEIEAMEGKLRFLSSQASMSTIDMFIRQNNDPVKIKKDISWSTLSLQDMGYLMKRGFTSTLDFIASFAQWLLIAVVSVSPLLAVAAVGYAILRKSGIRIRLAGKERVKAPPKAKKGNKKADAAPKDGAENSDNVDIDI